MKKDSTQSCTLSTIVAVLPDYLPKLENSQAFAKCGQRDS